MKTKKENRQKWLYANKPKAIFAHLHKQVKRGEFNIEEYLDGHIHRNDHKKAKLIDYLISIEKYSVSSGDLPVELDVNPEFNVIMHEDEAYCMTELVGLFEEFDEVM